MIPPDTQGTVGGGWGYVIRRFLEAATRLLPWMAVLFIPVAIGLFSFDPIAQLFGSMTIGSRLVYALIGVSAGYGLIVAYRLGPPRA